MSKQNIAKISLVILMALGAAGCKNDSSKDETKTNTNKVTFTCDTDIKLENGSDGDLSGYCVYNGKRSSEDVTLEYEEIDTSKEGEKDVLITATDKDGSIFVRTVKVTVKAPKSTPTPTPTETPTPEPTPTPTPAQQATSNNSSSQSSNQGSSNNNNYVAPAPSNNNSSSSNYSDEQESANTSRETDNGANESTNYGSGIEYYDDAVSCYNRMYAVGGGGCTLDDSSGKWVLQYNNGN